METRRKWLVGEVSCLVVPLIAYTVLYRTVFGIAAWGSPKWSDALNVLGWLVAMGYIYWKSGDSIAKLGIRKFDPATDVQAVLVTVMAVLIIDLASRAGVGRHTAPPILSIETAISGATLMAYFAVFFMAYLITRLEEIFRNGSVAVAGSGLAFGLMAWGRSPQFAIAFGLVGIALGVSFIRYRSLVAIMLASILLFVAANCG